MTKPLKVLIVEDNEDDAALLVRALKRRGFEPKYTRVDNAADLRNWSSPIRARRKSRGLEKWLKKAASPAFQREL